MPQFADSAILKLSVNIPKEWLEKIWLPLGKINKSMAQGGKFAFQFSVLVNLISTDVQNNYKRVTFILKTHPRFNNLEPTGHGS